MRHSAILAGADIAPNVKSELIDCADLKGLTLLYDNIFFRHGPEIRLVQLRLDELVGRYLSANQDIRQAVRDVHARYFGLELNAQSLTPGDNPVIGPTRFEDWLSRSLPLMSKHET